MATTLTYGRVKPETGDKGSVFFPALEDNIDLDDSHTHDGVDSPLLSVSSISVISQTAANASWSLVANGIYKQTITLPGAFTEVDNVSKQFKIKTGGAAGEYVYLHHKRISATTFDLYINDNTVDVLIIYR